MGHRPASRNTAGVDLDDPRVKRTRAAVFEAGMELLYDRGPEAITHAALASATDMSRTTLYKHWPTRVDLLIDVCDQIEPHSVTPPTGELRTDLLRMVGEMADTLRQPDARRVFSAMIAQAQSDPETREVTNALTGAGMADLEAILDAAVASGQLVKPIAVAPTANRLLGPLLFGALVTDIEPTDDDVTQLVDDWLEIHQV